MFYDYSLTGNQNLDPETNITLTAPVFFFASLAVFIVGIIVGTLEMVLFEKRFTNFRLLTKIGSKFLIYALFLLLTISVTYPTAEAIQSGLSPLHPDVLNKFLRFLKSTMFLNTMIQLSSQLILSIIYAAISENMGHNVLKNFLTGKYHTPKIEKRIFMFLDMKQSTAIAEKLGHHTYFDFLRKYYDAFSDSIIEHLGEVYQYVGDEIVITWEWEKGTKNDNWLLCFYELKSTLDQQKNTFTDSFGLVPEFRAGVHFGEVTTGEIGALKKEIVFTGDVLNTAARLQALAKEHNTDIAFSEELNALLSGNKNNKTRHLGNILLRGKSEKTGVFTLK
ncbi:MAG: hypothetical protein BalsKO_06920 [Balneolaceae bacterium]